MNLPNDISRTAHGAALRTPNRTQGIPMSSTPRTEFHTLTDNFKQGRPPLLIEGAEVVTASFARQLELELRDAKKDSEMLDWLLDYAIMHYESFELDDRESIQWAMEASNGGEEPCYGDPTTEEKEKEI